jgi:inosose dehydratase
MTNRRSFLKAAGIGVAAVSIPSCLADASKVPAGEKKSAADIKLGVASYSLRKFTQEQALDMTLRCGVNRITFKSMHLPLDSDKETISKTLAFCKEKGITLYGAGVITMRTKEDADQAFEYAKAAEMDMIIGVPYPEVLEYVEGKVKEYDIKLAIHNHGPGDDLYPSAESAYEKIKNMDKRMGLCIDIGHTKRINRDPEQDVKDYFDRVFDIHIKDVTAANSEGKTCVMGRGVIDLVSFLNAVVDMNYAGTLALEYEAESNDPLPGMMESLGYVKGVLATI